jgi:hypothetical protein
MTYLDPKQRYPLVICPLPATCEVLIHLDNGTYACPIVKVIVAPPRESPVSLAGVPGSTPSLPLLFPGVTSYTGYIPAALILYLALTCSYFNSLASVQLTANIYIASAVLAWAFDGTTYSIAIDGLLTFKVSWEPRSSVPPEALPRVSVDIRLSKDLDRTRWFGLGPEESHRGKKAAQHVGVFDIGVDKLRFGTGCRRRVKKGCICGRFSCAVRAGVGFQLCIHRCYKDSQPTGSTSPENMRVPFEDHRGGN